MHFFVTGTGTGVGKTHVTARWVTRRRGTGAQAVGLKPISAGDRDDAKLLRAAGRNALTLDEVNPCPLFLPIAPWAASAVKGAPGHEIDFAKLNAGIGAALARFPDVAVEGVGGWRVPLAEGITVGDWAKELGLPVLVVAPNALGVLSNAILTVDAIRAAGLPVLGIVLNPHATVPSESQATNREALARWTGLPVVELTAKGDFPLRGAEWLGL
jgi:dethiobiotin synthetase